MNCNFEIEDDKKANLNCKLNIEQYKEQHLFTFKTTEINTDENDFYLARLDEILLLNDQEEEEEEKKKEDKKKNNTGIIIGCVFAGAVFIGGITTLIICLRMKFKKKNKLNTNNNENKTEGNDRIIKYENNINSKEVIKK